MIRFISLLLGFLLGTQVLAQAVPRVTTGSIERLENFASQFVDTRPIDVWLPEGYNAKQRYNVLYMHDGQMLFDPAITWNHQSWGVDATMSRLIQRSKIEPTIVVGIWNNGKYRHAEYFPQKHLAFLTEDVRNRHVQEALQGKAQADNYLRFIVQELKPAIDKRYATRTEAGATFIMGSSMGGLISVYAMSEYPQVFGGAAGLSTHWISIQKPNAALPLAAFNYLRDHLPDPKTHRLYQDHGTVELDALYAPYQVFVDALVRDKGYTDANYTSRVFEGMGHNEKAWAERLEIPILFLMGKP
jgi:enterochelin esterase-like enzyme